MPHDDIPNMFGRGMKLLEDTVSLIHLSLSLSLLFCLFGSWTQIVVIKMPLPPLYTSNWLAQLATHVHFQMGGQGVNPCQK